MKFTFLNHQQAKKLSGLAEVQHESDLIVRLHFLGCFYALRESICGIWRAILCELKCNYKVKPKRHEASD